MSRLSTLLLGLLALSVLVFLCIGTGAPAIQASVLECTQIGLREAGLAGIVTEVDGRDVTLGGPGATEPVEEQAREVALGCGARVVVGDRGATPAALYTTSFCIEPGRISLAGSVPDPVFRSGLQADLQARAGAATIDGDLGVRAGAPDGYARMLERSAFELPQLEEGCIELEGEAVRIAGAIRSRVAFDALVRRFEASAGDDFRVSFDVEVPNLSESALACQAA